MIDTPVSEVATGAPSAQPVPAIGRSWSTRAWTSWCCAIDSIVNQAAKWSHMFGGKRIPRVTIRGIINRGGEQGAQHSQALHAWFAHVPGLRVVMPATAADARDLLIASVLCRDPVIYIDDRWFYDWRMTCRQGPGARPGRSAAGRPAPGRRRDDRRCRILDPARPESARSAGARGHRLEVVDSARAQPASSPRRSSSRCGRPAGCWSWMAVGGPAASPPRILACVAERVPVDVCAVRRSASRCRMRPRRRPGVLEKIYYPSVETVLSAALRLLAASTPHLKRGPFMKTTVRRGRGGLRPDRVTSPLLLPVHVPGVVAGRHSPFYIAARVGKGGRSFRMVKLRSMVVNADRAGVDSTAPIRRITASDASSAASSSMSSHSCGTSLRAT